jgi:hypothetical protein
MAVQKDFEELLALFNSKRIKYLIVGGYALAFHGAPRYTGDIDIFVKPDSRNADLIMAALKKFGFGSLDIKKSDFEKPGFVIQLGVPPVRVDLITSLTGVSWKESFFKKVRGKYGDVPVNYIGRAHLIKNKRALARKKDLADIEALGEK